MAFVYAGWAAESTPSARLSALRSHVAEVSVMVESRVDSVSSDGKSMTRPQLLQYYTELLKQLGNLQSTASTARAGGISYYRPTRPGPRCG